MDPTALLARVRSRLRRVVALGGAARLIAVLLAVSGSAILADKLWFLPGWLRLGLLLGIVASAAATAWIRLLRPLRTPLGDRELASFIERRVPALDGRLLTAVDGIPLGERDVALLSASIPAGGERALVPGSRLPRLLLAAGSALVIALGVAIASPPFWRDGLTRLLLPLGAHDWERSTVFSGRMERAVVAADEQAVLLVERTRGKPGAVRVAWDDGRGNGGARQLPGSGGPWHQPIALTPGPWNLTVSGGDAHPLHLSVLVVERPRLDGASATLTPPAYSGLPVQQLPTPACQVLPGSRLDLRLRVTTPPSRQLASVSARLGQTALELRREGEDWLGSATITAASELTIEAADADGIALQPIARFPVAADPDRAPSVSLSGPRPDEAVGPRAKVAVTLDAGDDFGLAKLAFTAAPAPAGAAASEPRKLFGEDLDGRTSVQRRLLVDVAALTGPGGTITLLGQATDRNDVSGPGVGTSAPLLLKVVAEEELRRDLERQLSEARDRISQARSDLAPALADAAKLPTAARTSAQDAARASELLTRVQRRWTENGLEPERIAPAAEAQQAAGIDAPPALAKAAGGDAEAARAADAALDKAERALDRMLSDSDLTRIIAQLLERERALAGETRTFVRDHLTTLPDATGKTMQADLATRQRDLAARTADAERRILSGPPSLEAAKTVVRTEGPADRMTQAAGDVASDDQRPRALERQQTAITALERILAALRGGDQAVDLGRRLGELAERQQRLAEAIENGLDKETAQREQERLRQETERLAGELKDRPEALRPTQAATNAQKAAGGELGKGDRAGAARDAATAADLLRAAQKALDPRAQQEEEKKKDEKNSPDVLALLRRLFDQEAKVLADSMPIDQRLGENDLDFAATRDLAAVAQLQDDILLRLREEGLKVLEKQPIATVALKRVEGAMQRALTHLLTPALGERGLRLERIALYELKRLIDIAENLPKGEPAEGGGGGGGGGEQPPFPPAAELALLKEGQAEIHDLVAAGRPVDVAGMQTELAKLIALVEGATRPGTRPNVLMIRARRSAEAAALLLGRKDRDATARHNMLATEESLLQLLAEAKSSGGSSGGKKPPPKPGQDGGKPPPPAAGGGAAAGANAQASAAPGDTQATTTVVVGQENTVLLQLPPERREQLRQAREQRLPAGALQLFERYLEKLEEP